MIIWGGGGGEGCVRAHACVHVRAHILRFAFVVAITSST